MLSSSHNHKAKSCEPSRQDDKPEIYRSTEEYEGYHSPDNPPCNPVTRARAKFRKLLSIARVNPSRYQVIIYIIDREQTIHDTNEENNVPKDTDFCHFLQQPNNSNKYDESWRPYRARSSILDSSKVIALN